jgi:hypothetical protein
VGGDRVSVPVRADFANSSETLVTGLTTPDGYGRSSWVTQPVRLVFDSGGRTEPAVGGASVAQPSQLGLVLWAVTG